MRPLTKEDIRRAEDLKTETVYCPDWGGTVYVKTMSGLQRDAFDVERMLQRGDDPQVNLRNFRASLAVKTVVDEKGVRMFSDEDAEWLGQKSALMLDIIYDASARLNGLRKSDVDRLTKNSESGQSGSSTSPSPSLSAAQSESSSSQSTPAS